MLWFVEEPDPTCIIDSKTMDVSCSQVEAEDEITGFFQAGPLTGTVHVIAVDTLGEETLGHGHRRGHRGRRRHLPDVSTRDRPVDLATRRCPSPARGRRSASTAGLGEAPDASVRDAGSDAGTSSSGKQLGRLRDRRERSQRPRPGRRLAPGRPRRGARFARQAEAALVASLLSTSATDLLSVVTCSSSASAIFTLY